MNFSPCSASDCPEGGVFSAEGLPPLPKGLSGVLSTSGGSWRDMDQAHSQGARIQAEGSRGDADAMQSQSTVGGMDSTLALLQKDMVDLRQLDLSLLSQLWSLHEDIQEFKNSSLLSEALFEADNGYSDGEEEEEEGEEEKEETEDISQCPPSALSSSLPQPSSNSRDQWIRDSLNVP